MLDNFSRKSSVKRIVMVSLSLVIGFAGATIQPAVCAPDKQLTMPHSLPKPAPKANAETQEDTLLVMVAADAEKDEIRETLNQVHGEVLETIGEGPLTTLVVRTEKGHLDETEKKLAKDKHFSAVQRNFQYKPMAVVNDPFFGNEWHLSAIDAPGAWQLTQGSNVTIAVLDTGCNRSMVELSGKTYSGYDAYANVAGQNDSHGHGSMVATTAAANTNNLRATASPARSSFVYPVKISGPNNTASDASIIRGIQMCAQLNFKLINLSFNSAPPYSIANKNAHSVLHAYMKWYHDQKGGLIFNAAGNDGMQDNSPFCPYLIVVSALGTNYSLTNFSNYGSPVWFTCPGQSIYCSNNNGQVVSVDGTSFASPLAASTAALVWSKKPWLTNIGVEHALRSTSANVPGSFWNKFYGYGLVNARRAAQ